MEAPIYSYSIHSIFIYNSEKNQSNTIHDCNEPPKASTSTSARIPKPKQPDSSLEWGLGAALLAVLENRKEKKDPLAGVKEWRAGGVGEWKQLSPWNLHTCGLRWVAEKHCNASPSPSVLYLFPCSRTHNIELLNLHIEGVGVGDLTTTKRARLWRSECWTRRYTVSSLWCNAMAAVRIPSGLWR